MPKGENEVDKFFDSLPSEDKKQVDIFETPTEKTEPAAEGAEDAKAEKPERRENRQTRRLKEQLQQEREARIAAEARAEGRRDVEKQGVPTDVPDAWLRMYGDTPESRTAWNLNKGILSEFAENAKKAAIAEIKAEAENEKSQAKKFEAFIDSEFEGIEDDFGVDITSNAPAAKKARRELLELVESLSPKDGDGNLTGYADFSETWKLYQERRQEKKSAAPNKELASRGMERSGDVALTEKQPTPGFFGWKRDLGL